MNWRIVFIFVLIANILQSEYSWERSSSNMLVQKGINALYNYDFDDAIVLMDSARNIDQSHPLPPFILISSKWLKTQSEKGYDASYEIINDEVSKTIPIYKKLIEENPDDPEQLLYLGSTYGLRARTAMAGKDWLDVLYFGYQGLKYIREAEKIDKTLLDVYMPIGLMNYYTCLSPSFIQWTAKLWGLSSNCDVGLKLLETAAEKSHYSWIEASNVLAYIYLHIERDYKNAELVLDSLVKNFPRHPYFSFMQGELFAKTGKWEQLSIIMPKLEKFVISGSSIQKNECHLKLSYIQALYAFHRGRYAESIDKASWMLANYQMEFDWLKGFAYLLRGKSYDLIGDRLLALEDYNEVLKMDDFYPEVKEAMVLIGKPFMIK